MIVIDADGDVGDAVSLDDLRARGRDVDPAELARRTAAVRRDDPFTFIYTSGTTGPPKGCVLTHGNYRDVLDMCESIGVLDSGEVSYLYLPLAHAFALLIQLLSFDLGGQDRLLRRRPPADHPRAVGDQADLLPVGAAHLREALHGRHRPTPIPTSCAGRSRWG